MEEVRGNLDSPLDQKITYTIPQNSAAAVRPVLIRSVYAPTDEEIISNILNLKVRGEALAPCDSGFVKEIDSHDLYGGGKKPFDIFSMCAEDPERDRSAHLLTTPPPPPSSISENGDIGAWKVFLDYHEPVEDCRLGNLLVGSKKTFIYDDDGSSNSNIDKHYGWFMTEYTTVQPRTVPSLNYVFCKIEKFEYPDVGEEEEEEEGEEEEEEDEEEEEKKKRLMELDEEAVKIAADAAAIRAPAPAV